MFKLYKSSVVLTSVILMLLVPSYAEGTEKLIVEQNQKNRLIEESEIKDMKENVEEIFKIVAENKAVEYLDYNMELYEKSAFDKFVPNGANLEEALLTNNGLMALSLDYKIGNQRVQDVYFEDGKVSKTKSNLSSSLIETNFNNERTERFNGKDVIIKKRSKEEIQHINNLIKNRDMSKLNELDNTKVDNIKGKTFITISEDTVDQKQSIASQSITNVYPSPNDPQFLKYNAKQVYGTSFFSTPLQNRGYDGSNYVRVYETLDYFQEVNSTVKYFTTSNKIGAVSAFWDVSRGTAISWLGWFGIGYSIYDYLDASIYAVKTAEFDFEGGKEATVYDPTNYHTNVEAIEYWDTGRVTLGWNYDSTNGYNSANWYHNGLSSALEMQNSVVGSNAVHNYNNSINNWGSWNWGVGQLGY
ncbi:hypothetical protein [Marinicrinis sediminis]|uniref:Bacterial toxin 44 domain-containing protein n=1 Tax=Marinicrinis sediminis TaxID=1652465 RepID=A0ABW5RDL9_9BACL